MIKDPRSTKYIYNLQITAPPNTVDKGRHIVIGSDTKNNLKLGYDINNSWIKSNGPLKVISQNNNIDIGSKIKIENDNINFRSNTIDIKDDKNIGLIWAGNVINFNSGVKINSTQPIELNNNLKIKGGISDVNPYKKNTEFSNLDGTNIISGDTNLNGNLKIAGGMTINKNVISSESITFLGGKHNNIQLKPSIFPSNDGINYLNGDMSINGNLNIENDVNIKNNLFASNNLSSRSSNISGKSITTELQVDGLSTTRGLISSNSTILLGGGSEHNPSLLQTYFPYESDKKNYIRGDTEITGNLNLPGDINIGRNLKINGNAKINGDLECDGKIKDKYGELFPKGIIVMWNGTTPPSGWALCDGNNNTPDLRGRFVLGYNPNGGKLPEVPGYDYNFIGSNGGSQVHRLTINQMPNHSHSLAIDRPVLSHNCWKGGDCSGPRLVEDGAWYGNTNSVGGDGSHNNMPPYYVLAYIIKL